MFTRPDYASARKILTETFRGVRRGYRQRGESIHNELRGRPTEEDVRLYADTRENLRRHLRIQTRIPDELMRRHMTI